MGKEEKEKRIFVGIDPGVETGYAEWTPGGVSGRFWAIETNTIFKSFDNIIGLKKEYGDGLTVVFEDARQRKWFGASGREVLQGAGSIKRECAIWELFCIHNNIRYEAVAPKNNITKLSAEAFNKITSFTSRTSQHARDAAMLIFGRC